MPSTDLFDGVDDAALLAIDLDQAADDDEPAVAGGAVKAAKRRRLQLARGGRAKR